MPNYNGSSGRLVRTQGRRPSKKLTAEQLITKRRLDKINPMLWKQLEAAVNGTKINHIGRGHGREP